MDPYQINAFSLLGGVARRCTNIGAGQLPLREEGFNLPWRDAGAAEQRQYLGPHMNSQFVKVLLTATVAAMVATFTCSSTYAQGNLGSMRAQYSRGNPQRAGQMDSDSSLSLLLGSPPDYDMDYLSGDDSSGSTRGPTSARGAHARNTKASQGPRMTSLYGAPKDYEDSYAARFASQPRKMDAGHQSTGYGLAAVEGLSSPGSGGRGGASLGKATSRRNSEWGRMGQLGSGSVPGSSIVVAEPDLATRLDSAVGGDAAATLYRSPW